MDNKNIEDYGIIGNLNTVALVGNDGSIDFMCFPDFDSPTIFASLLDKNKGGKFSISPKLENTRHKQLYLPDTNILLTRSLSASGVSEISDFMPIDERQNSSCLVRRVKTVRGELHYTVHCKPSFNYGRSLHTIETNKDEVLFISHGPDKTALKLKLSVPCKILDGGIMCEFTLSAEETASFILEQAAPNKNSPSSLPDFVSNSFKSTANFWRRWVARSHYQGRWREVVNRSALVLKLLTSKKYGSMVAAPTFGLPETIGGERNWDYRYTWIRDTAFTLSAVLKLGYKEEAASFMKWFSARCSEIKPGTPLQVVYKLDGSPELPEEILGHFEGYRGSKPVRIGNAAYKQFQLDIYGELLNAIYRYNNQVDIISHEFWENLTQLLNWVCKNWKRKDDGIWEIRSGPKEFLYSKLMCWTALDKGMRLAQERSLPAPVHLWHEKRDLIYKEIMNNFWNPTKKAFIQYQGTNTLDASALMMPIVSFLSPHDPAWISTIQQIEKELVSDSLVYRYKTNKNDADGLTGKEGTFSICSFWYAQALCKTGDFQKARFFFEKMLGYANHLGLYAEELGPSGEHLGNFPQAFSHLALINAAYELDHALTMADE